MKLIAGCSLCDAVYRGVCVCRGVRVRLFAVGISVCEADCRGVSVCREVCECVCVRVPRVNTGLRMRLFSGSTCRVVVLLGAMLFVPVLPSPAALPGGRGWGSLQPDPARRWAPLG